MQEREQKTASIYGLKDPRNGEIFYIGMSTDPYRRYWEHIAMFERNTAKNTYILDMIAEGFKPELFIIEADLSIGKAYDREVHWIRYYASAGFNLTNRAVLIKRSTKPSRLV